MENIIVTNFGGQLAIYRSFDLKALIREILATELDFTTGLDNPDLDPEILAVMDNPTIYGLTQVLLHHDVEVECDLPEQDWDSLAFLGQDVVEGLKSCTARQLGLDERSGDFYVGDGFIVATNPRRADYYGGLEYVDQGLTVGLGQYKAYSQEDPRIAQAINYLEDEDA